jgi:predicted unusual protein kinase regulating ubiquinone biosynthesis (AarF/ABC1/UbiB family)
MWLWIALGVTAALVLVVVLVGRRGLNTSRFARSVRIGRLWTKLSVSWLGVRIRRLFAGRERRRRIDEASRRAAAAHIAATMGEMKGALMKLGQLVSFISDDIPAEYRAALASLQAQAPPMDFPLLRDVAERELGKPLERAYASFDEKPLASASIGQVHRATLPSGEEVAVKIQYPGVAEAIQADLSNVAVIYRMMQLFYPNMEAGPMVDEIRGRIGEELDYVKEAANQREFHSLYEGHPFIRVPRIIASHSTARVITSEYIHGRPFADAQGDPQDRRSRWGEIIYRFVFGTINRHGMFNADPHPGNYLFDEAGRVVFLDYGCVKRFPTDMLTDWRRMVVAHIGNDQPTFRDAIERLNFIKPGAPLDTELLHDYWAYFYEPIALDREFTFTREYNSKSLKLIFAPDGRFAGLPKKLNMPRDFVFVNRIQWGVYSVLSYLQAARNWHRIQQELWFDAPGSTDLGQADDEYRAKKKEKGAAPGLAAAPGPPPGGGGLLGR